VTGTKPLQVQGVQGVIDDPVVGLMIGVSPQTAVGTDLLYAVSTKITGSAVHGWRDTVDWEIVRRLAYGSVPAPIITLAALSYVVKVGKLSEHIILVSLAGLLAAASLAVLFRSRLIKLPHDPR
jgi:uncharacterized membrane protein YfcA